MKRFEVLIVWMVFVLIGSLGLCYAQDAERIEELEQQIAVYQAEVEVLESQLRLLSLTADSLLQKVERLETQVAALEAQCAAPLKIAYLNAEEAFTVFTDAVQDLRQKALDKQKEKLELQQQYLAATVTKEEYESRQTELEVELLHAQLNIDIGTIDRMIASPGFADIRHDLERLREEAQPVIDMVRNLISTVRVGVLDPQEIEDRYAQVKNAFTQLDSLLTQAATSKIVKAAEKIAVENGYDLVLRTKNVIIYRNTAKLVDITDMVKTELAGYLW